MGSMSISIVQHHIHIASAQFLIVKSNNLKIQLQLTFDRIWYLYHNIKSKFLSISLQLAQRVFQQRADPTILIQTSSLL